MDNGRLGGSLRSKDYNSRLQLHRFIWFPSAAQPRPLLTYIVQGAKPRLNDFDPRQLLFHVVLGVNPIFRISA